MRIVIDHRTNREAATQDDRTTTTIPATTPTGTTDRGRTKTTSISITSSTESTIK